MVWFLSPQYLGHMSSVNLLLMEKINDTIFDPEEAYIIPLWFAINSSVFGSLIYKCMNSSTSTHYPYPPTTIHLSSPSAQFPLSWVELKRRPRSVFWQLSLSLVISICVCLYLQFPYHVTQTIFPGIPPPLHQSGCLCYNYTPPPGAHLMVTCNAVTL